MAFWTWRPQSYGRHQRVLAFKAFAVLLFKTGASTSGRTPSAILSSAPVALCSHQEPGLQGIICFVLSPLRHHAIEGPATGSAIGRDRNGRALALRATDTVKSVFNSFRFSLLLGLSLLPERYSGMPCCYCVLACFVC